MIPELTPGQLAEELKTDQPPRLLDVRESHELEISKIEGVVHIPLGELPFRLSELDPSADWVVICRSGGRSGHATQFMLGQGFTKVRNMASGMNGWAQSVDQTLPVY